MSRYNDGNGEEVFQTSTLMILLSYTVLCGCLIAETILMSWELWAIPLLVAAVLVSWVIHVIQFLSARARIWGYTLLMMASFFFYGIHVTSAYDMGYLMILVIMIYTTAGEIALIYVCQITYYVTLGYDLIVMTITGTEWDGLLISRTILHIMLMLLAGWLARTIIKRWSEIFGKSGERIAELNESTNRMNSFMANLSHELRTPINAILGITNVMLDKEVDNELKDDMEEILVAGNRLADQVGDILDYSEIEMNSLVVNEEDYMIASVLNDLVIELRPILPEDIELIIDVDAEIPSILRGDSVKLRKIMYHLINNGLKYTKEGGVYVKLSAIKQSYGINLCIEIRDTGVGMTKDELDRIYNRFYQADSGRVIRSGGLGISMVIVSGFVSVMGGFITILSDKGEGTTIRVSIPQAVVDDGKCMVVSGDANINLGAYLNFSKYSNPTVREFYNNMVLNIVRGLRTTMHRVDNEDDLRKLVDRVRLTHLFVSDDEYMASRDYIESLTSQMQVIIVARESFKCPEDSLAQIMEKPFYCIPVVTVLNSDTGISQTPKFRMHCEGVRALVVDDEPMNLSVAKGIFRRYGMDVFTANSGAEAIDKCRQYDYDIVFMDHMMPGMDGVETMKRIRNDSSKTRKSFVIVALTANALSSAKEMFMAEGFDGFVSKPIELVELERVLKHVLPKSMITYEKIKVVGSGDSTDKKVIDEKLDGTEERVTVSDILSENNDKRDNINDSETQKVSREEVLASCGIDIKAGLSYCEDDEELYDSLLEMYVEEYGEKKEKMDGFLQDKDMKNYAILVHALKSTSLMIGAGDLSAKAKALEHSSKEDNIEYVQEHHGEVMSQYKLVTETIKKVLEDSSLCSE